MSVKIVIKPNTYFDSVSLMSISTRANKLDGVEQAFVAMATEMNKGVLKNLGLLTPELEQAKNGDLMIVINGKAGADNEQLLVEIEELFNTKAQSGSHEARYATIASAKKHIPESNLAVISVNGLFAAREARQALQNDLNVMLFSDNVSVEDELALKQLAHEKGLLMMGPDCGTAIINGAALCFGNAVRRGNIGIVGASGTGSQELSVRIHEFGGGVSQLIGTGGRDLSEKIGGLMMLDAIGMLENDPQTEIIVLISKPPAPAVARKVLERARACRKPVVSAVGHEIDTSILDYVADLRAPTPSAAAELCVPDQSDVRQKIFILQQNIQKNIQNRCKLCYNRFDQLATAQLLQRQHQQLARRERELTGLQAAVQQAAQHRMQDAQRNLQHAASVAQSLSPYAVLARGYTLTERNGVPCSVEALHPGEAVTLRGARAAAECRIEAVHNLEKQTGE